MPGIPVLHGVNPLHDVYTHALAAVYHNKWPVIEPSFAHEKESNVWELVQRDATISQGLMQLRAVVASKSWQVEAATKEKNDVLLADLCREMVEGIENFDAARAQMVDARFRARSFHFPKGKRRLHKFNGTDHALEWWLPGKLQHVDKLRVRNTPKQVGELTRMVTELFSVQRVAWEEVPGGLRHKMVSVIFDDEESRLGYGRGILDTLHFLWWAGSRAFKDLLQGVERYAQGTRIGKVNTDKRGSSGTDAATQLDDMLDVLEKSRGRHDIAIDAQDDIDIKDAPGTGLAMAQAVYELINRQKMAVIMGSVLPFGQSEGVGSLARSMTEETVADQRVAFDRCVIDKAITVDLIGGFIKNNRAALVELGLDKARVPHFVTTDAKLDNPRDNAERLAIVLNSGVPIKREEYYAAVDLEQPKEGDDVIRSSFSSFAAPGGGSLSGDQQSFGAPNIPNRTATPPGSFSPAVGDANEITTRPNLNQPGPEPDTKPTDQAESELLGKVGGITGAVEIFKALGEGTLTRETAVRLFMMFFHLDLGEAQRLVGESGENPPLSDDNERAIGNGNNGQAIENPRRPVDEPVGR